MGCEFTKVVSDAGGQVNMDCMGSRRDNVMVERFLGRTIKYKEVYVHACTNVPEARVAIGRLRSERAEQQGDEDAHEKSQPLEQEAEVVSGSSEDGIDRVALGSGKIVPVHTMIVLDVADHGFGGTTAFHLALDGRRHAPLLA